MCARRIERLARRQQQAAPACVVSVR
jgi:hypothetical protein